MKKNNTNFKSILSPQILEKAIFRACSNHRKKPEVKKMMNKLDYWSDLLYDKLMDGSWKNLINYRDLIKTNPGNGKVRHIKTPSLVTRVYQHLLLELIEDTYYKKDNLNAVNCKPGCGITATDKNKSVVKRMKNLFYDKREYEFYLNIDQRKCYDHVKKKVVRKALKYLFSDKWLIDFALDVCFVDGKLPIGTPTSPVIHHILLLRFDYFVKELSPITIRYADDNFLAFKTKEEANTAKWRIMNFWWYELEIRAKRHNLIIAPFTKPIDFCGFVFHRTPEKKISDHNKGYTAIRRAILRRAKQCKTQESWAAYYGILSHSDINNNLIFNIMSAKNFKDFVGNIRIDREHDYPELEIKTVTDANLTFVLKDYIFKFSGGKPNYVTMVVLFNRNDPKVQEILGNDNPTDTGNALIRVIKGNFSGIITYLQKLEEIFGGKENILPIKNVELFFKSGYIFKNSTNIINTIDLDNEEFDDFFGPDPEQ